MTEVICVYRYPLTGARAEALEVAPVGPAGIQGDRELVLYDGTGVGPVKSRVSQKGNPTLATVQVSAETLEIYIPNYGNFYVPEGDGMTTEIVDEFGDQVPVDDMGNRFAARFSQFLGLAGIRLGRKTQEWLSGGITPPSERHNRPLHIVNQATVREVQSRMPEAVFGAERFRPNVVVDGELDAFEENEWLGGQLVIGGVTYAVTKLTERCPVPGYDQRTGRNRKDVPKLYRGLPKSGNKPVFGVYAVPMLELGQTGEIAVGSEVSVSSLG